MEFNLKEFNPVIADISPEALLKNHLRTLGGGLGGLTGDNFRAYADLSIPAVGVILACTNSRQKIDSYGWQTEEQAQPIKLERINEQAVIKNRGHDLYVGAHLFIQKGATGYKIPVLLLTTDLENNKDEWDRGITRTLYDSSSNERKLSQQNVLGQGTVKLLEKIWGNIKIYHLNEGHAALASLLKDNCAFTNHTPVDAAFDKWDYKLASWILGDLLPKNIRELAGHDLLNMNQLAANRCKIIDGVSRRHAEVCRNLEVFKGKNIGYVTNGIHPRTWVTRPFEKLFDSYFPGWGTEPRILSDVDKIPLEEILEAHGEIKRNLIGTINSIYPVRFEDDALTIVWARRFATYKRPELVLEAGLQELATKDCPIQLIFAGAAHPKDIGAKKQLQRVYQFTRENNNKYFRTVFIEDYGVDMLKMLCGADVWLNTPRPPEEASGTSGMKAALNGVINLTILDGWVCEGAEMFPDAFFIIGDKSGQIDLSISPQQEDKKKEIDRVHARALKERIRELQDIFYFCSDKPNLELARRGRESIKLISHFNSYRVVKQKLERWGMNDYKLQI